MVKVEHLLYEILKEHPEHPNLLVSHESSRPLIHSIFAERSHKVGLELVHPGVVQVVDLLLLLDGNTFGRSLLLKEYGREDVVVVFEVGIELIKVCHADLYRLRDVVVGLDDVLLAVVAAIEEEQLELGLAVAELGSLAQ
mgnify:CR=1 FL=1